MRSSLALSFTEPDMRRLQAALPWQQRQPGYAVRWLDIAEARRVEPRISDETLGATLIEGGAAGLDEESTPAARDEIGAALLKILPAMADARVAQQTACLRPVASDGLLVLGGVPGLDQVYVATGGGRKGILYGRAMGHAMADLVIGRRTRVALDAFAPGRFA